MDTITEKMKAYAPPTQSRWREVAEERRANQGWLKYSLSIALKMLNKMEQLGLSQQALAERMGCSQQYVSKILKGRENLTLDTLSKIEKALDLPLLSSCR
ncbi:MAG: helix-turn-helix transcriptional regulator [Bacteroidales bacterium]|nr:helix-turn-helix transcriptional regulator [Bacteroidales bacterium]